MEQLNLLQEEAPMYLCAQCNAPVLLDDGTVKKPCGHTEAAVLANMEAVVRGTSLVS